jgi:NADH-quinone oxidoreductase subunit E
MTAPGVGDSGERIFIRLGPPPEEPNQFVVEGAPQSYSPEVRARLEVDAKEIIGRYPSKRSALLPLLHLVQSEYRRGPTGDYLVGVCTNTLCAVMGGDAIFETLVDHLGVRNDQTTPDGKITLQHIECNAACDFAPVVMVNWEFFDNQTPESARELVDSLREGKPAPPTRGAPLCAFRETSRILAGLPDQRPDEGQGGAGAATLAGLKIAKELGMEAPPTSNNAGEGQ